MVTEPFSSDIPQDLFYSVICLSTPEPGRKPVQDLSGQGEVKDGSRKGITGP